MIKNPPANARDIGDWGPVPGWGRSPGGRNGNLFQYSSLGNPMDKGACQAQRMRHGAKDYWIRRTPASLLLSSRSSSNCSHQHSFLLITSIVLLFIFPFILKEYYSKTSIQCKSYIQSNYYVQDIPNSVKKNSSHLLN